MVFAAVGMTDGTRICPGEHNENMRDLTLWLTGLDHVFFGCFFSSEIFVVLFSLFLAKKPETPLTFPAQRGVTSCFVASLVRLMMVFCRKTCAPPRKQQVWHWPLTRVWKFFVLASLEYPLVVRDIREENTPSWVCIKTPSMEEAHYPPAFLSWCCRCCWIFQKPSVWVCCCGVCTINVC